MLLDFWTIIIVFIIEDFWIIVEVIKVLKFPAFWENDILVNAV